MTTVTTTASATTVTTSSRLALDSSGRLILDELMRICTDITGIPFGHMKKKYVSGIGTHVRVYVRSSARPASSAHASAHAYHIYVRPGDITDESWEDIMIYNLKIELTRVFSHDAANNTDIIARIQSYPSRIAHMYDYVADQQRKHAHDEPVIYNRYIDRCLYEVKVIFDK